MKVEYVLSNLRKVVEENFILPDGRRLVLTPYQENFIKAVLAREKKRHLFLMTCFGLGF
jgi:hypothetical protein